MKIPSLALVGLLCGVLGCQAAEPKWADWVEPDFPFYSSALDARDPKHELLKNNLTPRGLVLNLGHDCWVCYDVDLLRVSAIWQGKGVTPDALAQKSYLPGGTKTRGGLFPAPQPIGEIVAANGIYPGWQTGETLSLNDPREPAPDPEEVGRGGLPPELGRLEAVQIKDGAAVLDLDIGGTVVREMFRARRAKGVAFVERHVEVGPSKRSLLLVAGQRLGQGYGLALGDRRTPVSRLSENDSDLLTLRIAPHKKKIRFCLSLGLKKIPTVSGPAKLDRLKTASRWSESVITKAMLGKPSQAYLVDDIALPKNNPWKRNVRPGDIQFRKDGTGVVVTIDGDVWLARGLGGDLDEIRWSRFTSGLHEPMTCAIRDNEIFVFDKNGIWKLRDTNGDGEADVHELFSNAFGQTLDMREFPTTIRNAPKGEFVIAKGGQQKTKGKHNGSVLRISADGRKATLLGYGFRQPAVGVNIRTGLVTSGDQEGNYIPSTPLHIVRDGQFYGYLDDKLHGRENYPAPIADPLTWIPHSVNASAISQVWLFDAKMGPLNDSLIHIGFTRPQLFHVALNKRTAKPQAAVTGITTDFQHPPLNGSVNPRDGQLYVAGFQINGWGNVLNRLEGMSRIRYTGQPVTLPKEVIPMDKGVLIRFGVELNARQATNPDSYSIATWGYRRTHQYGSPQYKADGEPGIDWHAPSSAYLSKDRRSVFVGVPDMKPVMQLRIGWSLATQSGLLFEKNAYTTPYELAKFDPSAEGFGDITVDLTPRKLTQRESGPITVEEGRRLYGMLGCIACHTVNGEDLAKVGPTWMGLYGSQREVVIKRKKTKVTADAAYLRESILDPRAKVVRGFERGEYQMPSYAGVVTEDQVQALTLFIEAIKEGMAQPSPPKADGLPFE